MLPAACHWIEFDDCARLYWNRGWVATVTAGGAVTICWGEFEHGGQAASQAQGRRFVERWVAARRSWPPTGRTREIRARVAAVSAPQSDQDSRFPR